MLPPRVHQLAKAVVFAALIGNVACASKTAAPVAAAPELPPPPPIDTRVGWILQLEHQRVLRDAAVADPAAPAGGSAATAATSEPAFRPARTPDLADLLRDADAAVRARAALAIGRVKLAAGRVLLEGALADPAANVRANAAFGLGLLADRAAIPALQATLSDSIIEVRGRAVEALGLIGDGSAAPAVTAAAASCPAVLAPIAPDSEPAPEATDVVFCRLALFALVRMQNYDGIAQLTLDSQGQPVSRWWPVAFALQRSGDRRAVGALRTLARTPSVYASGFALRGLATLKDSDALPIARAIAAQRDADVKLRVAAVRLIAQVGQDADARTLGAMLVELPPPSPLALEVTAALGVLAKPASFDLLVDGFGDPSAPVRAASMAAAARVDPDNFLLILSGLGRDREWSVRAALATILGGFPSDRVTPALVDLATDEDTRVRSSALQALAAVKSPELPARLVKALQAEDFVERGTAARLVGEAKLDNGVVLLVAAYDRARTDTAYGARGAVLDALATYGGPDAIRTIEQALSDREWPIRTKAATLLRGLGRADAAPVLPAPSRYETGYFQSPGLLRPSYSPRVLIDTRYGTIELQLDVVNATLTSAAFVELARGGFFNGIRVHRLVPTFVIQAGDPRGDGEGGPGFTIRDELSPLPYLRGTLGMALDWADTGGSQWFITLSPQPHLDGRYTAFGSVVSGWDILDQISPWDVIDRVRIWDGVELR